MTNEEREAQRELFEADLIKRRDVSPTDFTKTTASGVIVYRDRYLELEFRGWLNCSESQSKREIRLAHT